MEHATERHVSSGLFVATGASSRRSSSYDRTGANLDYVPLPAGQTVTLLDVDGPGCVTHLYVVMGFNEITDWRDAILRCCWDGEATPSVEVPLGDFVGLVNGRVRTYRSHLTAINPGDGCAYGLNAYFPMPFGSRALVTLENRAAQPLGGAVPGVWFHVDYDLYREPLPDHVLRFHAQYRQERPTTAVGPANVQLHSGTNLTGDDNYVALDARGEGQLVGIVLGYDNPTPGWFGEGDDMVFIDGESRPPSIHGTGTEEIFGGAASPTEEYAGPYSGWHLIERTDYSGVTGMYRWYVQDPIRFTSGIRWTIEHGHANSWVLDMTSVAFWYQREPHAPFPPLPDRTAMLPPLERPGYEAARELLMRQANEAKLGVRAGHPELFDQVAAISRRFYAGDYQGFLDEMARQGLT